MAQTVPLAAGTTAANSTDIPVTTGSQLTLFSGEADKTFERCKLYVMIKESAGGTYAPYEQRQTAKGRRFPLFLTNQQRSVYLNEPGIYRVVRSGQVKSVGVIADDRT
jgi:hypothetical protein